MSVSHFGRKPPKAIAVFDVGSASIGVGIAVRTPEGVRMPWSIRLSYAYQHDLDYTRFKRSMLAALLEGSMRLTSEGIRAAQELESFSVQELVPICVLSPPWFIGSVQSGRVSKEQGMSVTDVLVAKLEEEARSGFSAHKNTTSWRDVMGRDTEIIDEYRIRVELDGYRVTNYSGKKAHSVGVTTYIACAPQSVLREMREVLEKTLPNHATEFRTSTSVAYRALEVQNLTEGSLLVVELGGEITAVSLIRNGGLSSTSIFPMGTNHVLRTAFPTITGFAEARGRLETLTPSGTQKGTPPVPNGLTKSLAEWHAHVAESVTELVEGVTPPRNVVLLCDTLWKDWFLPRLREPWKQPGMRQEVGFFVVDQEGVVPQGIKNPPSIDGRIASMLRGILTG